MKQVFSEACGRWLQVLLLGLASWALLGCGGGGSGTSVGNAGGAATAAPVISAQPQALTVKSGQTATFTVSAAGDSPLTYRWQRNGVDVDGATAANYSFSASQANDDQAVWTVRVSNAAGSVTSQPARLTVRSALVDTLSFVAGDITLAPGQSGAVNTRDGAGTQARFDRVQAMVVDSRGQVYVAEDATVRKISASGEVTTIAGAGEGISHYSVRYADGTGAAAGFNGINDIALGPDGNLYVTDTVNHAIRKVTPAGVVTTVVGGPGSESDEIRDGPLATAKFRSLSSIAVDAGGSIYVLDDTVIGSGGQAKSVPVVRKISPQGQVTTVPGSVIGSGGSGRLAVDASGNILVAVQKLLQWGFCPCPKSPELAYVLKISPSGEQTVLAGSASQNPDQSVDGTGGAARFVILHDIAVDANGDVYVADSYQAGSVRKITPAGVVTTVVGSLQNYGAAYPAAVSLGALPGRVAYPDALALSPSGDLYLTSGHTGNLMLGGGIASVGKVVLKAVLK